MGQALSELHRECLTLLDAAEGLLLPCIAGGSRPNISTAAGASDQDGTAGAYLSAAGEGPPHDAVAVLAAAARARALLVSVDELTGFAALLSQKPSGEAAATGVGSEGRQREALLHLIRSVTVASARSREASECAEYLRKWKVAAAESEREQQQRLLLGVKGGYAGGSGSDGLSSFSSAKVGKAVADRMRLLVRGAVAL